MRRLLLLLLLVSCANNQQRALAFLPSSSSSFVGRGNTNNNNKIIFGSIAGSDHQVKKEVDTPTQTPSTTSNNPFSSYDCIIVGSGIGGLSCAAMLSLYGYSVAVFESHYAPGGAAHGFNIRVPDIGMFTFDTGPSFFSGLNPNIKAKSSNPLRTILDAIEEEVECIPYTTFGLKFPEGDFIHTPSFGKQGGVIEKIEGKGGVSIWENVMKNMKPLEAAVDALPTSALRADLAVAVTTAPYLSKFAKLNPLKNLELTKPFQSVLSNSGITQSSFTQNWLDLLCFCLSGLDAKGTITAEMAMMMGEFYADEATMDCPVGGAKAIVDSLVRGIEKRGGKIFLNSHVSEIIIENGQATGIKLKKGDRRIKANKAVISNMSVWDLYGSGIVIKSEFSTKFIEERMSTPVGKSFMHLHIGFKASREELKKLQAHYMYIDDWDRGVEAEGKNFVPFSLPKSKIPKN